MSCVLSEKTEITSQQHSMLLARVIETFELEETFKGHLVQLPCSEQGHLRLSQVLRAPSSLALKVSRDGASATSLGNLCQCLTTLIVKYFFHISNLHLLSFSLKPFPLVLSELLSQSVPFSHVRILVHVSVFVFKSKPY